jgi:hypothetical protein
VKPYFLDDSLELHLGDCRKVLPTIPDKSVDAIITDPPYEIGLMGKGWDSAGIAYSSDIWRECLRVLKPGGHLAAFGAPRTYHRLACAIEDAGFQIRDSLHWIYGSGFPKGQDVARSIDRHRDDHDDILQVTRWLAAARKDAGWNNARIDALFGFNGMAGLWTTQGVAGTGTTLQACAIEGMRGIGIEREPDYVELARIRLTKPTQPRHRPASGPSRPRRGDGGAAVRSGLGVSLNRGTRSERARGPLPQWRQPVLPCDPTDLLTLVRRRRPLQLGRPRTVTHRLGDLLSQLSASTIQRCLRAFVGAHRPANAVQQRVVAFRSHSRIVPHQRPIEKDATSPMPTTVGAGGVPARLPYHSHDAYSRLHHRCGQIGCGRPT